MMPSLSPARIAPAALGAALALAGCVAGQGAVGDNASSMSASDEQIANLVLEDGPHIAVDAHLKAMGPDGWHRLALYANWDSTEDDVWQWIVTQPDCDRATALAIFWKAEPEYYLRYLDARSVPAGERAEYGLLTIIRDRWLAGGYTRSELAFDPDVDAWPLDFTALRGQYGGRVDALMPPAMRVRLAGRKIDDAGEPLPGVFKSN